MELSVVQGPVQAPLESILPLLASSYLTYRSLIYDVQICTGAVLDYSGTVNVKKEIEHMHIS